MIAQNKLDDTHNSFDVHERMIYSVSMFYKKLPEEIEKYKVTEIYKAISYIEQYNKEIKEQQEEENAKMNKHG